MSTFVDKSINYYYKEISVKNVFGAKLHYMQFWSIRIPIILMVVPYALFVSKQSKFYMNGTIFLISSLPLFLSYYLILRYFSKLFLVKITEIYNIETLHKNWKVIYNEYRMHMYRIWLNNNINHDGNSYSSFLACIDSDLECSNPKNSIALIAAGSFMIGLSNIMWGEFFKRYLKESLFVVVVILLFGVSIFTSFKDDKDEFYSFFKRYYRLRNIKRMVLNFKCIKS